MNFERTAQVWGVSGNLGGGKSLTGVSLAFEALRNRWFVASNIRLNVPLLSSVLGFDVSSLVLILDDLDEVDWFSVPAGSPRGSGGDKRVLVLLDEVAEWYDQYNGTSPKVKAFLSWLRHSSKRSQDVVLIVQRSEYLAKSLRILCSRWIWCEDLATYRLPVVKMHIPFCGHLVLRTYRDKNNNVIAPMDTIQKSFFGRFYDTAQDLSGGRVYEYALAGSAVPVRVPLWYRFNVVLTFLSLLLFVFGSSGSFSFPASLSSSFSGPSLSSFFPIPGSVFTK